MKAVRSADILGLRAAELMLFDKEETNGIKFYKSRTLGRGSNQVQPLKRQDFKGDINLLPVYLIIFSIIMKNVLKNCRQLQII